MRGYTEEQLKWLEKNCKKHGSYREMTDIFNFTFGESKKWKNLHSVLKRHGYIDCDGRGSIFSKEQKEFLQKTLPLFSYEETTRKFNEKFGERKTRKQIEMYCTDNRIKRNLPPPEIGSEHISGNYIMVRINNDNNVSEHQHYKMKQHVVWEKHHGKIPKGKIIVFLDNNSLNCDISNLYLTDRKVLNLLTVNKWHFTNREQKLAALKWCELYFAQGKDIKEENPNKRIYIPMSYEERYRVCPVCGKTYEVFQRRKSVTCSRECASTLNHGESLRKYMLANPRKRSICKVEGCGKYVKELGYCDLHYNRFRSTGDPLKIKRITWNSKADAQSLEREVPNKDIRLLMKEKNLRSYQLSKAMGYAPGWLGKKMSKPMCEETKKMVLSTIYQLENKKEIICHQEDQQQTQSPALLL